MANQDDRYPSIHCLIYSESGGGKSSFAATFPKPMLVFSFDPFSKEIPYLDKGDVLEGNGYREVYSRKTKELLIRVEYFHDPEDEKLMQTEAVGVKFKSRVSNFRAEYDRWQTVVFDSITSMELSMRMYDKFVVNKGAKDPRQHYGASTGELENYLLWKIARWPMNVVVIAHTDYDKAVGDAGVLRYKPRVPGDKQLRDMGWAFTEMYHPFVKENEDGTRDYKLQTQTQGLFPAATRIGAPNPCDPHYQALWANRRSARGSAQPATAGAGEVPIPASGAPTKG